MSGVKLIDDFMDAQPDYVMSERELLTRGEVYQTLCPGEAGYENTNNSCEDGKHDSVTKCRTCWNQIIKELNN